MSCFDGASPVWGPALVWQPNVNSPATVFTESYLDSLPGQYIAQGMTCAEAKQAIVNELDFIGQSGSYSVVKDGFVVPAAVDGMVTSVSGQSWRVNTFTDGALESVTSFPPLTNPWHARTANVDFFLNRQFWRADFSESDQLLIQIPVDMMLLSFDFDAWWACASGCVAERPTPRMGMQTFSNYTYSMLNSFGQVPKI